MIVLLGTADCHFEENARKAVKNFLQGRPLFDGQKQATIQNLRRVDLLIGGAKDFE